MATALKRYFNFKIEGGYVENFIEAASQTFLFGDPVTLSSNRVAALQAAGSEHQTGTATKWLGFALRNAKNVAAPSTIKDMPVWVLNATARFWLPIYDSGTPANAIKSAVVLGVPGYALRNQGGIPCVNLATAATGSVIPVQTCETDQASDTYVQVMCRAAAASLLFP